MIHNQPFLDLGKTKEVSPYIHTPRKRLLYTTKILSLVLSAVLFGAVSAGTFYGVNQLLPQDDRSSSVESSASSGAVLTSLASTSYSRT